MRVPVSLAPSIVTSFDAARYGNLQHALLLLYIAELHQLTGEVTYMLGMRTGVTQVQYVAGLFCWKPTHI